MSQLAGVGWGMLRSGAIFMPCDPVCKTNDKRLFWRTGRLLFMTFKKLNLFLMLFCGSQGGESAKVSTLIGFRIFFAGIKPVFSRF